MKLPERFDPSRLPWQRAARLGPLLAWSLALAVTAWVAADLFWRFSAPRAPALPFAAQADPQAAAQAIASRHLMGRSADTGQAAGAPAASSRFIAHAVVTGAEGRPGWAISPTSARRCKNKQSAAGPSPAAISCHHGLTP